MERAIDANALQELCNRRIQDTWNSGVAPVSWAEAYADFKDDIDSMPTLTPPNEPLTLEELREMDEIPIYVVTEKYGSGWCVLNWHGVKKSYTYFSRTGTSEGMTATPLSAKTYGDLWTAYRRPPEGEADA